MSSAIYAIINHVNGKRYIGSAVDVARRHKRHSTDLNCNRHHSVKLQRAWNKYGECSFSFQIIELTGSGKDELISRETYYIDKYDSYNGGYNSTAVANSCRGIKHSEERREAQKLIAKKMWEGEGHREKVRVGRLGYVMSQETKDKIGISNLGRVTSEETKEKLREFNTGKTHTDETRFKISEISKNMWESEEHRENISNITKERWKDEEYANKMSAMSKSLWEDKEYRDKIIKLREGKSPSGPRNEITKKAYEMFENGESSKSIRLALSLYFPESTYNQATEAIRGCKRRINKSLINSGCEAGGSSE